MNVNVIIIYLIAYIVGMLICYLFGFEITVVSFLSWLIAFKIEGGE